MSVTSPASSKARFLVVDDNEGDQVLLREAARATDTSVEITACLGGQQALLRLRADSDYALIVVDLNMSLMNGLEFLVALDELPSLADVPRVLFSSSLRRQLPAHVLTALTVPYLSKPAEWPEYQALVRTLSAAVRNHVGRGETERFLRDASHVIER